MSRSFGGIFRLKNYFKGSFLHLAGHSRDHKMAGKYGIKLRKKHASAGEFAS